MEINDDKKLENDIKWFIFVTKRADRMTKLDKIKAIREDLKKMMNPFSQDLVIEVSTRLDPEAKIKDKFGCDVPAESQIEKAKSTKVYKTAANRDRIMSCSATAQRMLWFIAYEIGDTDDWIELDPEWYKEVSGAGSRNMYKKGKEELVRYGYISRTEHKNIYWVNPVLMFAGNRITKFPSKVLFDEANVFTGKAQPKKPKEGMKFGMKKVNPNQDIEDQINKKHDQTR